jgi:hypothetical protein
MLAQSGLGGDVAQIGSKIEIFSSLELLMRASFEKPKPPLLTEFGGGVMGVIVMKDNRKITIAEGMTFTIFVRKWFGDRVFDRMALSTVK